MRVLRGPIREEPCHRMKAVTGLRSMAIHGHTAPIREKVEPNKGGREKFSACELTMTRFIKTTIPCMVPPSSRERAHPGNVKLVASWQSALDAPFGVKQWKLRLQLAPSVTSAACSARP